MAVGSARTTVPPPSRVRQILDEHRPREMVDNMALIIMDQTYDALLEILGAEAPRSADGHVEVTRPVDPADPASPLLSVNASAAHCCISLINGLHGGATSAEQESKPQQYRLPRATITASPGALHLARVAGGGGHWTCADVWPDVSGKGLFGVLEAIKARVGATIRLEASLLRMARGSGCQQSPKVREICEVRVALEKMRAAVDITAIMRRRRCQKRRRPLIQEEITCGRLDVDQACDAEALARRLSALHVGQKRGRRPVQEISCRQADDAEELAKRLRTLHV
ncbi:hypothetical protein SETIT_9G338700v2 [Setaria italica]|uniref:Uncharacterized protein n=1 Tax=Setaria italica TaxID=4555 RepID=A0A368SNK1_SETIT|nr:hypothetical protein SETIT_9G338700v2 [Setaria italica]